MPSDASLALSTPSTARTTTRKLTLAGFTTAIGAIVLICSEIWLAAIAGLWAMDGFFNLSPIADYILAALVLPLAIWATWKVAMLAISAESDPENA